MSLQADHIEQGDLEFIAAHMRQGDLDEVSALGQSGLHALADAVSKSTWALVLRDPEGHPVCAFGLALRDDVGVPWCLGTVMISRHRKSFMRYSREVVAFMRGQCSRLLNIVDSRNLTSIRWLEALGYSIHKAHPHVTASGHTFYPFTQQCSPTSTHSSR